MGHASWCSPARDAEGSIEAALLDWNVAYLYWYWYLINGLQIDVRTTLYLACTVKIGISLTSICAKFVLNDNTALQIKDAT